MAKLVLNDEEIEVEENVKIVDAIEEAGVPILFHVGGEHKMRPDYHVTGGPQVLDFHGVNLLNYVSVNGKLRAMITIMIVVIVYEDKSLEKILLVQWNVIML